MRIPGAQGCVKQLTGDEPVPSAAACTWSEANDGGLTNFPKGALQPGVLGRWVLRVLSVAFDG